MLLPGNTAHMVAKRRSQAIWTPRRKAEIRLPAFATILGDKRTSRIFKQNLVLSRSFQNMTETWENFLCDVTSCLQ
ncbi:hypothetical protein NPIL_511461, partial [Nephila pilipes]